MDLYKIVSPNGECVNGGIGAWSLPDGDKPGEWWVIDGPLAACQNGLHVATAEQVPKWLPYNQPYIVYRVEVEGEVIDAGEKMVVGKARLLPRKNAAPDFARAIALRDRRRKRAAKLLNVAVPKVWREYLRNVGTLPKGHPGAAYQTIVRDAQRAHDNAYALAEHAYLAATTGYERMPE